MTKTYTKSPEILKPYLTAGNTTFTLYSAKLDKRYTYHILQDKKVKNRYIVKLMYKSDNEDLEESFKFLGLFYEDSMTLKVNSIGVYKQDAAQMLDYFLSIVDKRREWPTTCEFYPSRKCARCGRTLTTPESITRGIGPDCLKALGSSDKDWQLNLEDDLCK